ncbi:MAG: ABC transporter permease subunit [Mycobacteriales bacterium]
MSAPPTSDAELAQARALPPPAPPVVRPPVRGRTVVLGLLALTAVAWTLVLSQAGTPVPRLAEVGERALGLLTAFAGAGQDAPPAYTDPERLRLVGRLAVDTVVMSVLATGLAAVGALLTVGLAARSLAGGPGADRWDATRRLLRRLLLVCVRALHVLTRSVPEVVWALLVVFLVRPGILAGALALAVHEFGVLGRLGSDLVDDVDRGPLRSLRAAGAGKAATLTYGVLPQALPQLITLLLYRWEVTVRASVVVGFLTGAGLGYQLRLDLSFRRWTDVALVLLAYIALVWAADATSSVLRRLAR